MLKYEQTIEAEMKAYSDSLLVLAKGFSPK